MPKASPVPIVLYAPQTPEGRNDLARRAAEVHADRVIAQLKKADCPWPQKLRLLNAVAERAKEKTLL